MNFPGAGMPGGAGGGAEGISGEDPNIKRLNSLMESCFAKTALAGVAGFGLGALFGMFMASMSYDTPFHTATPQTAPTPSPAGAAAAAATTTTATSTTAKPSPLAGTNATAAFRPLPPPPGPLTLAASQGAAAMAPAGVGATPFTSLPLGQQLKHGFKDMGARSYSTAKNFAMVGALFSGIECGIEGFRAKNDMTNGVAAGCVTGAILARGGGPQAAAIGCAGFAAFSAAIDAWLRAPKDE